jgi:anti-sigma factor RsiW
MIDGELSEEEQSQLRAHLDECDECKAVYEAFNDISTLFRKISQRLPKLSFPA